MKAVAARTALLRFGFVALLLLFAACALFSRNEEQTEMYKKYGFKFSDYKSGQDAALRDRLSTIYPKGTNPDLVKAELEDAGANCFTVRIERRPNGDIWAFSNPSMPDVPIVITPNDPNGRYEHVSRIHFEHDCRYGVSRTNYAEMYTIALPAGADGLLESLHLTVTRK